MDAEKITLKSSVIQGFSSLIIREFFLKLLSFIGQIFLARLLLPSDFGTYVIIVFIISLFGLFSDIGLSIAIIQKKEEPTHPELSTVFWLKIALSLVLIILIWNFSPLIKLFYPSFTDSNILMIKTLSVILLLGNIRAIPISLLERKIKYNLISVIDIAGVIIYYFIALAGAFFHFGIWSFIIGAVTKEIIETAILYFVQPFIPQLVFSKSKLGKMIKFGAYVQGNSLLSFFISSITPLVGGRLSGAYAVGLLDFANSLTSLPNIIAMNFSRVSFAGYSKIQGETELLSKSINKSVSMLAILLYIFPLIFIGMGRELVYFIYTEKWVAAVPALYWFSISVFFYPALTSLGQIILSIGKSKEIFWATFLVDVIGVISALFLVNEFGFIGIAMANLIIYFVLYLSYVYILKKTKLEFSAFYILIPPLLATIFSIIVSLFLNIIFPSNPVSLVIKIALSTIAYIIFMYAFVRNSFMELLKLILNLILPKTKLPTK